MKFIRNIFDKTEHLFVKGGKFEKLYPLYEVMDTFFFTSDHVTSQGPHVRDGLDTKRLMSMVIVALIPCTLFGMYNVGYQSALANGMETGEWWPLFLVGLKAALPIIIVSYAVGGLWEVLFAVVRKHEVNEGFLVTGLLYPLILPATIPLWQVAVGVSFGVVIGKEIFGGTGMNILNPALTARAFLYFSYPAQISGDSVWILNQPVVDGFSGATPLGMPALNELGGSAVDTLNQAAQTLNHDVTYDFMSMFWGFTPGSIGETSAAACLIGAVILIITGVGSARIMISVVVGGLATAGIFNLFAGDTMPQILSLPAHYQLVMGGFMFGAIFMATDPVSACRTETGKIIYGLMIGILTVLIRLWNPAYPEGMMLAILFMNVFAPLIDYYLVKANVRRRLKRVEA